MRKASRLFKKALSPNFDSPSSNGFAEKVHAARKMSFTSSTEGGMGMLQDFDPLVVSAFELSELLNAQATTSVEIVETYLHQIEQHNRRGRQLRALISVAPKHDLLKIAKSLDDERLRGEIRGPLHGIPIVLKDNIMTDEHLGMDTTVGM
jgi:amidase